MALAPISFDAEPGVRTRLVQAADSVISTGGIDSASIDAVALAAGVSRATAFRQLGKREDMIVAVGVLRAATYARECVALMGAHRTAFTQLESAFQYLVRTIPDDPVMNEVLALRTADELRADVREASLAILEPPIELGRQQGQIRSDLETERLVHWIIEQLYLALQQRDRSEESVRARVYDFIAPALAGGPATHTSAATARTAEQLSSALAEVTQLAASLSDQLRTLTR
jgi:AcrR family transcriptional regulator